MRLLRLAALATILLLAYPASAGANHVNWHWRWGHNYVGPTTNPIVTSGWDYWDDQWLHKHSGSWIWHGWVASGGTPCEDGMVGYSEHYHALEDVLPGFGGYLYNRVRYSEGYSSYLEVDSYNF